MDASAHLSAVRQGPAEWQELRKGLGGRAPDLRGADLQAAELRNLDLHRALGAFISLIVVNCLILGRAEAFASKNSVGRSILDGLGMGVGFTFALLCLGGVREILGNGSLFGVALFPAGFQPWIVMILPSGGFFTLGLWLLLFNYLKARRQARQELGQQVGA